MTSYSQPWTPRKPNHRVELTVSTQSLRTAENVWLKTPSVRIVEALLSSDDLCQRAACWSKGNARRDSDTLSLPGRASFKGF